MKRILILIFIFSSFIAGAQYKTFMSLDTFPVPNNLTAFTFIASKNHVAYLWDISSKKWIPIGGSIDSLFAGIQDQINTKVDQETTITINGDTQPLTGDISFGPFLTGTDTVYLHNQISLNGTNNLIFGDGLHKAGNNVVALHEEALWNSAKFQGRAVSGATPLNGQVYTYNDTTLQWVPRSAAGIVDLSPYATITRLNDTASAIRAAIGGSTPTLQDVFNSGSTLTADADISNGSGTNYLSASNWAGINFQTSDEPTDGTSSYFNFDQYGIDLQHRLFGSSDSRLVINNIDGVRMYNNLGTNGAEIVINNNVIKLRGYEGLSTLTTLELGSSTQDLHLFFLGLPTYADEAAAAAAGLSTDQIYKTSTGELRIKL